MNIISNLSYINKWNLEVEFYSKKHKLHNDFCSFIKTYLNKKHSPEYLVLTTKIIVDCWLKNSKSLANNPIFKNHHTVNIIIHKSDPLKNKDLLWKIMDEEYRFKIKGDDFLNNFQRYCNHLMNIHSPRSNYPCPCF